MYYSISASSAAQLYPGLPLAKLASFPSYSAATMLGAFTSPLSVLLCCTAVRTGAADASPPPPIPPLAPCSTCRGPRWSWDTFPAFFHGSDPNGTAGGGFTEEALDTIARFPIVTLEKWQGASVIPYTWEEDAWVVAAKQIKARSPHTSIIVWYDSVRIYQQNRSLNPGLLHGCTTGNFQPGIFLDSHPVPFLAMQADGRTPVHENMGCHVHNMASQESRRYWQSMCLNMTRSGVIDGCGCDASWMTGTVQAAQWNMTAEQGAAWGEVGDAPTLAAELLDRLPRFCTMTCCGLCGLAWVAGSPVHAPWAQLASAWGWSHPGEGGRRSRRLRVGSPR